MLLLFIFIASIQSLCEDDHCNSEIENEIQKTSDLLVFMTELETLYNKYDYVICHQRRTIATLLSLWYSEEEGPIINKRVL